MVIKTIHRVGYTDTNGEEYIYRYLYSNMLKNSRVVASRIARSAATLEFYAVA